MGKNNLNLPLKFYKMQGSGNDFILIPNAQAQVSPTQMSNWAKVLCKRSFAVGADGLIFLEQDPEMTSVDFRWHFFNADGSRAEMCGNGSRCAARLAYELGLSGLNPVFATDAGPIHAEVLPDLNQVKVELTTPKDLKIEFELNLDTGNNPLKLHFVNTGVPHSILFSQEADLEDIGVLGPKIRYHKSFFPDGTNLNIVQVLDQKNIYVRTYERGVESETFACGTGAAASVFIANKLGYCLSEAKVRTSGGEELKIFLEKEKIFLQGKADLIFAGSLDPKSFNLVP